MSVVLGSYDDTMQSIEREIHTELKIPRLTHGMEFVEKSISFDGCFSSSKHLVF